ncbi:Acetyltransferase (GNAT) family protein [Planctomycetes bacterium CA13]|uniref:Acetyltransferase (GNAT) family protein n=1 Tax=Novipirellula herctigrandis TaxID=2527986 RepID=A0A5C5Z3E0_9BACT|nr:Acetyltransferase (GNAT) family protein [Planctomycetes bacterium CA13]
MDHRSLRLQRIQRADHEFLFAVFCGTRPDVMQAELSPSQTLHFLRMQFQAQHNYYHEAFPNADYSVVLLGDVGSRHSKIGRLYVDHRYDEIRILDIALLPEFQSRGFGTAIVRAVIDRGWVERKPIRIHVELFSRQIRFYDRLGFQKIGEIPTHQLMEHPIENQSALAFAEKTFRPVHSYSP